ncbi:MAG: STAS domain-containing protein [Phycisphaerales bacterium]
MNIEQTKHGAVTVLRPCGAITSEADATRLRSESFEVLGKTLGRFVIDASEMAFVDSYGLEALVDLTKELGAGGRSLCLCSSGETLREILSITGLISDFSLHEDVQSAVRSFL